MNMQNRRYVFIDFENLMQVKFKKLEKIASKIFVFVEVVQDKIPLDLVRQAQSMGKNLRWIVVGETSGRNLNYHMAFVMGKLHQKSEADVAFAVVSEDPEFDPLVSFINASGRNCLRIKRKKEETASVFQESEVKISAHADFNEGFKMSTFASNDQVPALVDDELIARTAEETVKRLIRSGNRPQEVSTLKNYILLHNQELALHGNIDRIIQKMKESKDIEIRKGEVIYNF